MKRAPTKIWLFVLQSVNKQWFVRFVRSGKIVCNTETYKRKATATKVQQNWLKLGPLFADGNAKATRAVPYEIQQLPEWQATHPNNPYVQNNNVAIC